MIAATTDSSNSPAPPMAMPRTIQRSPGLGAGVVDANRPRPVAEAGHGSVNEGIAMVADPRPMPLRMYEGRQLIERIALARPYAGEYRIVERTGAWQGKVVLSWRRGGVAVEPGICQNPVRVVEDERRRPHVLAKYFEIARELGQGDRCDERAREAARAVQRHEQLEHGLSQNVASGGRRPERPAGVPAHGDQLGCARGETWIRFLVALLAAAEPPQGQVWSDVCDAGNLRRRREGPHDEGAKRLAITGFDRTGTDRAGDEQQLLLDRTEMRLDPLDDRPNQQLEAVTQQPGGVVPGAEVARDQHGDDG
jgi:hypothetical protein